MRTLCCATQTVFYIREVRATDDPSQPLQLSDRPELPEPRPPLPGDTSDWPVATGGFTGVTQEIRWDDGEQSARLALQSNQSVCLGFACVTGDGSMAIGKQPDEEFTPQRLPHLAPLKDK